jgi:hypothetical protein
MKVKHRSWLAMGVATVAVAAAISVFIITKDEAQGQISPRSPLATVDRDMLDFSSLDLTQPTGARAAAATLGRPAAEQLARTKFPGYIIREVALLEVTDTAGGAAQRCLCWVVSSLPENGQVYVHQPAPIDGQPSKAYTIVRAFHLDFIDAVTGKYLYSAEWSQLAP